MKTKNFVSVLAITAVSALTSACVTNAQSQPTSDVSLGMHKQQSSSMMMQDNNRELPALIVTNDPPPEVIYRRGSRDTVLADDRTTRSLNLPSFGSTPVETVVTRKAAALNKDLTRLDRSVGGFQERLRNQQVKSDTIASEYYALVASVNTELQAGSTPGNPILTERWNAAQEKLDELSDTSRTLNNLAADVAAEATEASFLQENVRATYGLSGAVKEDHARLREIEDGVNQSIIEINRLLTTVNDEIKRRDAYLRTERLNMQTMSLSIANGELYGQSLTNNLFKRAAEDGQGVFRADPVTGATVPPQRRPLVIIRFDRANVKYDQALYAAVGQALEKYPAAKFDLVAISTANGNPAETALASAEARKNGEAVLRSLTQMGLPMERVNLTAANSRDVRNSEIHLYIQ